MTSVSYEGSRHAGERGAMPMGSASVPKSGVAQLPRADTPCPLLRYSPTLSKLPALTLESGFDQVVG